jgi:hypothetical protein
MPREFMQFNYYGFALSLITSWVKLLGEYGESFEAGKSKASI